MRTSKTTNQNNGINLLSILSTFILILFFLTPGHSQSQFARATYNGDAGCGSGTFFDPINGGTCWSCPSGYARTVFPVDGSKACERAAYTDYKKATSRGRGTGLLGTDCPSGAFWDPNGNCYSCPSGYSRTTAPVTSSKACSKRIAAAYKRATNHGSAFCGSGTFFDPINGGGCYSCPSGYERSVFPVNGNKACINNNIHQDIMRSLGVQNEIELMAYLEREYGYLVNTISDHLNSLPAGTIDQLRNETTGNANRISNKVQAPMLMKKVGNAYNAQAMQVGEGDEKPAYIVIDSESMKYKCRPGMPFRSLSVGVCGDVGMFVVTAAKELGAIFNLCDEVDPVAATYGSTIFGIGPTFGLDGSLGVSLWKDNITDMVVDNPDDSALFGFTMGVSAGAGMAGSWWFYIPEGDEPAELAGFTLSVQGGASVELEFSISWTKVDLY